MVAGMVFLYPEPTEGSFWMKNTLIPLSIAFFDEEGTILRILDMEPCREDPCPLYNFGVAFTGALEANRGAFARLGVLEGDRIELLGIGAEPATRCQPPHRASESDRLAAGASARRCRWREGRPVADNRLARDRLAAGARGRGGAHP